MSSDFDWETFDIETATRHDLINVLTKLGVNFTKGGLKSYYKELVLQQRESQKKKPSGLEHDGLSANSNHEIPSDPSSTTLSNPRQSTLQSTTTVSSDVTHQKSTQAQVKTDVCL